MPDRAGGLHGVAPARQLNQWTPPQSSISTTTAIAIGVVFGGILVLVLMCYCFAIMRRQRSQQEASEMQAHAEAEEQRRSAARAERRRRRLEFKGVPAYVIDKFPTTNYVRPHTEPAMDLTTRRQMMDAATSALNLADLAPSSDDECEAAPMPLPPGAQRNASSAYSQSMFGRLKSAMSTRAARYHSSSPADAAAAAAAAAEYLAPAVAAGVTPMTAQPSAGGLDSGGQEADPQGASLAAAHRASCATANSLGKLAPLLRGDSLRRMRTGGSVSVGHEAKQPTTHQAVQVDAFADGMQCAICLCDFEDGDVLRRLPCTHDFHKDCIDSWMQQHRTCPLCRHVLYSEPPPTSAPEPLPHDQGTDADQVHLSQSRRGLSYANRQGPLLPLSLG